LRYSRPSQFGSTNRIFNGRLMSAYLPAGSTKSSFSGRIASISELSPNGATLKSKDTLRIVHESSTSVVLACPRY
jgi:hypothetical protein